MLARLFWVYITASLFNNVLGRERWLQRDNRAVFLYPRRLDQEHPGVLSKLRSACPDEVCGQLAIEAVLPLLADQPECSQQDFADTIIDASRQFDASTQANMIAAAIEYRQAEKNTPPDTSTDPPILRNSVFCQRPPRNPELFGLVQAQDPDNDPDLFFDPATESTVHRGDQQNTFPLCHIPHEHHENDGLDGIPVFVVADSEDSTGTDTACPTAITISVTGDTPDLPTDAVTVTAGGNAPGPTPTSTSSTPIPTADVGDFGSCSVPQIEFGAGFDGRRGTSFRPADRISFNRQSSESIDTIAEFICEALVNLCRADDKARSVCASARSAASSARNGTGAQADMFNDQFGIPTKFADVTSLDENGNPIPGTGLDRDRTESASLSASSATTNPTPSGTSLAASVTSAPATGFGDFGSCSTPAIQFGTGFDGRRETSFQPADRSSYNQASSRDVGTVARAICNALSGSCRADQTAINNCNTASSAASAAASNTGAQADAFNAAFGLSTNFAAIQPVNDTDSGNGNNGGGGASATSTTRTTPTPSPTSTRTTPTPTPTPTPPSNNGGNGNNGNNNDDGNLQTFNGSLGGIRAPSVTDAGNGRFQVQGNTFNNLNDALRRSCDIQVNECSNAANASNNQGDLTVQNCSRQGGQCRANAG